MDKNGEHQAGDATKAEEMAGTSVAALTEGELLIARAVLFDAHRQAGRTYHRHRGLPKRDEARVSRVGNIYDVGGKLLNATARLIAVAGLGRVERGMYVVTPRYFPAECEIHLTVESYFAVAKVGGEFEKFVVWPEATVEGVWETYERRRECMRGNPEAVGIVYRPRQLGRFTRPSAAETNKLVFDYWFEQSRPLTIDGRPRTPRVLAAYREPPADADDPLQLGAMLAFALGVCAKARCYTGLFLPPGAEEQIPDLLELAREIDPRLRVGDERLKFTAIARTDVGVITEENAHDSDLSGNDYVNIVTHAGRRALFAGVRTDITDRLFSAVVAAPGSFPDDAQARDQLLKHFGGADLILVWTTTPPPSSLREGEYDMVDTLVTFDARHLGGRP